MSRFETLLPGEVFYVLETPGFLWGRHAWQAFAWKALCFVHAFPNQSPREWRDGSRIGGLWKRNERGVVLLFSKPRGGLMALCNIALLLFWGLGNDWVGYLIPSPSAPAITTASKWRPASARVPTGVSLSLGLIHSKEHRSAPYLKSGCC